MGVDRHLNWTCAKVYRHGTSDLDYRHTTALDRHPIKRSLTGEIEIFEGAEYIHRRVQICFFFFLKLDAAAARVSSFKVNKPAKKERTQH